MQKRQKKSLKFQGNTGEDRRAGGGGGGGGAGLISMKMRPPVQPLPYGCHDTVGAWRMYSYRAARLLEERRRKTRCHPSLEEAPPAKGGPHVPARETGAAALRWICNRNLLRRSRLRGTKSRALTTNTHQADGSCWEYRLSGSSVLNTSASFTWTSRSSWRSSIMLTVDHQ